MTIRKIRLSRISALHYYKLFFRSALFLGALILYVLHRMGIIEDSASAYRPYVLGTIALIFIAEMILRFFPSSFESMGCQKQFKRNFIPTDVSRPRRRSPLSILAVAAAWIGLNAVIGLLYFTHVIDAGILVLISLAYAVCDMICILFFCPFQTWFMKNKCCGSCRIYNWDYAMMCTPLIFIPNPYAWSVLGVALLLLLYWEIVAFAHPERFAEETNGCLSCAVCKEKLCHHKKQLRSFLKANKESLLLKGNTVIEKAKKTIRRKKSGK